MEAIETQRVSAEEKSGRTWIRLTCRSCRRGTCWRASSRVRRASLHICQNCGQSPYCAELTNVAYCSESASESSHLRVSLPAPPVWQSYTDQNSDSGTGEAVCSQLEKCNNMSSTAGNCKRRHPPRTFLRSGIFTDFFCVVGGKQEHRCIGTSCARRLLLSVRQRVGTQLVLINGCLALSLFSA